MLVETPPCSHGGVVQYLVEQGRQPPYRIPERARGERGKFDRVIPLDTLLRPEFQTKRGIVAGFRYSPVQSEEFFCA